jgi:hypothetical protein
MSYDATSTAPPLPTASPPLQGGEKAHALAFIPSPSQGKGWDGVANANSTSSACGISSFARSRKSTCFSFCSFPFSRGRLGWGCCCSHDVNLTRWNMITASAGLSPSEQSQVGVPTETYARLYSIGKVRPTGVAPAAESPADKTSCLAPPPNAQALAAHDGA